MALFDQLVERVDAKARAAADAARRSFEAIHADIPGVRFRVEGDTLVVEASGLARRWICDTRLRFAFWRRG